MNLEHQKGHPFFFFLHYVLVISLRKFDLYAVKIINGRMEHGFRDITSWF